MKKKKNQKEKINIIQLLLPGLFIIINWIILQYATNENTLIYLSIDTIIIIILAFYNDNKFLYTLVALLIYSLINFVPLTSCSSNGGSGWFPCMYESIVMVLNFFWFILYLIIYGIRCLKRRE